MQFILTRAHSVSSFAIRARLTARRLAAGDRITEQWSHAASLLMFDPSEVVDTTFMLGGVVRRSLAEVVRPASAQLVVDCPLPNEGAATAFLLDQLGKDYDWRSGWGFAIGNAAWYDPSDWFCFELVAAQMRAGGLRLPFMENLERVTAVDLLRAAHTARQLAGALRGAAP